MSEMPHGLKIGDYIRTPRGWRKIVGWRGDGVEVIEEAPPDDAGVANAGRIPGMEFPKTPLMSAEPAASVPKGWVGRPPGVSWGQFSSVFQNVRWVAPG